MTAAVVEDASKLFPSSPNEHEFTKIIEFFNQTGWHRVRGIGPDPGQLTLHFKFLSKELELKIMREANCFVCASEEIVFSYRTFSSDWEDALPIIERHIQEWEDLSKQIREINELLTVQIVDLTVFVWLTPEEVLLLQVIEEGGRWVWRPSLPWSKPQANDKNIKEWNYEKKLAENISSLFPTAGKISIPDCSICFQLWLDSCPPTFSCHPCGNHFHEACLRGWFERDPLTKSVFGRILANCPACLNPLEL